MTVVTNFFLVCDSSHHEGPQEDEASAARFGNNQPNQVAILAEDSRY
jgi:hypothetical protein